jgi:phosphoglycolate phosphatase
LDARVLLFDLDGTLTDPRSGIVTSIRYALERLARSCPSDDVLATFIGPPLRRTFSTLLQTSNKELIEEAVGLYRERYAGQGLFELQVYDGVRTMLAEARGRASATYVATLKPTVYADRIIRHFGLGDHFAGVYGAELDERLDDKAELLAHLLTTEKVRAETAVMIGDRAGDIVAARANGLPSIGVLWGYGSETELATAGADLLCAAPSELLSCVARLDL